MSDPTPRSIRVPSSTACRICPGSIACSTCRAWRFTSARRAIFASALRPTSTRASGRARPTCWRAWRDRHDGHALRGRGAAAREQPHQVAGAALQRAVPRRQVVSVPEVHHPRVSARRVLPRRGRPACPVLRSLPERLGGEGQHPAAAEGISPAHLRGHGVRQPLAALPAAPDPALQRALRRADRRDAYAQDVERAVRFLRGETDVVMRELEERMQRSGRRAEVRGGRRSARPDGCARARAAPAGRRHDGLGRRCRCPGGGRRRRAWPASIWR